MDFSSRIIVAMQFQGTPLAVGYATADDCFGGLRRLQCGRPYWGGLVCMFYTQLAIVVDGGGAWNSQVALSCFFAGQETAELEEVAVYQRGVSCKVATLRTWVAVMIKTGDGKKRDNVYNGYPLHAL